ncbi:MAG: ABC transporter ATP-binding protein [Bacteroidetes bacterium]|nr:ABC transporter ATP-binding protein [Bacteroidota bacterium]
MKSLMQLWQYIRPYRKRIWLNVVFNAFSAVFAIFSLLMLIPFLKLLFNKTERVAELPADMSLSGLSGFKEYGEVWLNFQLTRIIGDKGELAALLTVCLIVVVIFFLKNLFRYMALYVVATIKKGVIRGLHSDIYHKLVCFPLSWFDSRKKGDTISRFTSDVQEVEYGIIYFLEAFIKDPITIVITLTSMFLISTRLTLIVLVTLPISGLVIGKVGQSLKHESRIVQDLLGNLVSRVAETVGGMRVIKSFTAQDFLRERFDKENKEHFTWSTRMLRKRDLSSPLAEFLGILVVTLILWLGGKMVFNGQIQPETFITFIVIFSQVISPSKAFANAYYHIQKGLASMERIEEVVLDASSTEMAGKKKVEGFNQSIEFKDVSFSYKDVDVLREVSLEINKGERVALTGPSGSGKSTITDLMLGLYSGLKGSISIDGVSLEELDLDSWRRQVALVPQETILFNDTLYNNILFGDPDASKEAVLEAARAAHVDEFADQLPERYDSLLGDNGNNLSGGQRQRIAIARALLKKAPVIILDEATSALDADKEDVIAGALMDLPAETTVIIIAHRSSTIRNCDKNIEIRDGRVTAIKRPLIKA